MLGALLALLLCLPASANAWWNKDWGARKQITLNTSDSGVATKQALGQVVVPLRLHTGNFEFTDAKPDGSDLRFVGADDKTPLKFHIEQFDSVGGVAVVWVQVPQLAPGVKDQHLWMYYGNDKAAPGEDAKGTYDSATLAVLHFGEKGPPPKDVSSYAHAAGTVTAQLGGAGLLGNGASFNGSSMVQLAAAPTLKIAANGALTFSAWIKPTDVTGDAIIFSWGDPAAPLVLGLEGGKLYARLGSVETPRGGELKAGAWQHVALMLSDRLAVYLNGAEVGTVAAKAPDLTGALTLGATPAGTSGYKGDMDEVVLLNAARSPDWVKITAANGADGGKLISIAAEGEGGDSGSTSYFAILLSAVTPDGWVVIAILGVMMVISVAVMVLKAMLIARTDRSNEAFAAAFRKLSGDVTRLAGGAGLDERIRANSSLYRLYTIGIDELKKRFNAPKRGAGAPAAGNPPQEGAAPVDDWVLSGPSLEAIRASLNAGLTREMAKLNSKMVLLTIAISGGPFLGLLGTVIGVMITFAAIAAAGDVNVNAIAPGIAAALVATVAGLTVAIPALFGYNYLGSRIKGIVTEMQVFVDEFETRIAETYS
jgi:biopolymer transport protein ExbB